jgi:seryl-tRNA(Sec) selenium transferase
MISCLENIKILSGGKVKSVGRICKAMNIYKKLGIRTMINASDVYTSIGGSCMSREVLEAMKDAAKYFVDIEELQKKAGERIALLTHNEAAYVSAGAGAGVVLVAAACITGNDPVLVERLPDTSSMKNEIIVIEQHCKNNPYPHLIEMSGAKLVKVRASTNDIEDAINKNTAAMFYFDGVIGSKTGITVEEFVRIGKLYIYNHPSKIPQAFL